MTRIMRKAKTRETPRRMAWFTRTSLLTMLWLTSLWPLSPSLQTDMHPNLDTHDDLSTKATTIKAGCGDRSPV
ncbi:hypothetical protein Esi_0030_0021 [Ectocarpus siliculosus]|uniref:Uncharacterized protein n=1 Tax=Ectocarpus siliculosus TaxID=2880 RepID=D8LKF1_ECTSI|nr:hypothetical protein Esi_0030_0021 [Ectocarpus siliculosus]|eukprot:CBN74541.1 hypothetical protein Esi_0030_0021 [Ectocarpus siliculosus]